MISVYQDFLNCLPFVNSYNIQTLLARESLILIGARGFRANKVTTHPENVRGIYDDGMFLLSSDTFAVFMANCDPTRFAPGTADLQAGIWLYKIGTHGLTKPIDHQYEALVQAGPVLVMRDGGAKESGYLGINIHRGSYNSVSSEGCQTIHPSQFDTAFMPLVKSQMRARNQETIKYVLFNFDN